MVRRARRSSVDVASKERAMVKRIAVVLSLLIVGPAAAQRLVFDGVFDTNLVTAGREIQVELPVSIPFSFTVDLKFPDVRSRSATSSTSRYFAPQAIPGLITENVGPNEAQWLAGFDRVNSIDRGYAAERFADTFLWSFTSSQSWRSVSHASSGDPPLEERQWSTSFEATLRVPRSYTPAQVAEGASFQEMLGVLDRQLASAGTFDVSAFGFRAFIDGNQPSGQVATSQLTGSFRLTAIQCRAPSGLANLLAGVKAGLLGGS
jgi:hypothetical protein